MIPLLISSFITTCLSAQTTFTITDPDGRHQEILLKTLSAQQWSLNEIKNLRSYSSNTKQ